MFSLTKKAGLICAFAVLLTVGCKRYDDAQNLNAPTPDLTQSANANNAANLAKDDIEGLHDLVKLPYEPEEDATVWRETTLSLENGNDRLPAPSDKKLVAVMKFSVEDAQKLIELASSHQPPPQPVETNTETWFPAELIAASSLSGNETLKGTVYSAEDFFQPPYSQGRLIRISDTDYFILELMAM